MVRVPPHISVGVSDNTSSNEHDSAQKYSPEMPETELSDKEAAGELVKTKYPIQQPAIEVRRPVVMVGGR